MRGMVIITLLVTLSGCWETEKVRSERFFLKGNEALSKRDYLLAIDMYTRSLAFDQSFAQAFNNRGVAKMEAGRASEAVIDYNEAIRLDSGYIGARFNRAYAYEAMHRPEKAINELSWLEEQFADSAYVHFYKGLLLTQTRAYASAKASFRKAILLDTGNLESYINLATVHYFEGQLDSATQILSEVLSREPGDANALNALSQVHLRTGNLTEALEAINQALEIAPDEAHFLNNRGLIYLKMDSLFQAIKDINRSIVADPRNTWAYRNKGIYLLRMEDYARALEMFERVLKGKEYIDEIYTYLGQAYAGLGRWKEACESWKEAMINKEISAQKLYLHHCE